MEPKQYTGTELLKQYKGKYLQVFPRYNHDEQRWYYEVRHVSKKMRKSYSLPEDCLLDTED